MEDLKPKRDRREYNRAWRAANPEYNRAWRAANPEYNRAWRAANAEKKRESNRAWRAANPEKERESARARRRSHAHNQREYSRARRETNTGKLAAVRLVGNLIASGRISSPWVCQNCHIVAQLDAHHDDYSKPLEIRWLCRRCHQRHHAAHGEAPNGATPWYYPIAKRYKLRKKALRAIIAALPQNKEKQL